MAEQPRLCPDSGTCHHECGETYKGACWRVFNAMPLTATGWDNWPVDVVTEHRKRLGRPNIPKSPIVGEDDWHVEIIYACRPNERVDIQARLFDVLTMIGGEGSVDLGAVIVAVDLTEHVVLSEERPLESSDG